MKSKIAGLLAACLMAGASVASAGVVFESAPNHGSGFADFRNAEYSAIGRVNVSTTQTIDQIGVLNFLPGSGTTNMRFFIYDITNSQFGYLGAAKAFSQEGNFGDLSSLNYKLSDLLSYTFVAGNTYAVGAVYDSTNYQYADFGQTNTANGFSSLLGNVNANGFASVSMDLTQFCCSIGFELLTQDSRVPEPATLALVGLGFAGVQLRRRRKAA